jgi:beta-xylosidase
MIVPIVLALIAAAPQAPRNPVLEGADPHIAIVCNRYWIYPTGGAVRKKGVRTPRFYGYSSPDLQHWTRSAPLLDMDAIPWIDDDGAPRHHLWAPALAQANGRFYFYYSVGPQNPTPSRIGVAVSDSPGGPFRDSGRPLLTGGDGFEAIDPMVFIDPPSGKAYLYAGGSAGAKLRVFELSPDLISLAREIPTETPPQFTEGPFVHLRGGVYYLSYSHGRWNDASYSVHYATARSPEGPWAYRGEILSSDATHKGPGHHSIVQNPGTRDWYIAYHRWERASGKGPFKGKRMTAVQPLAHGADGFLQPIRMSDSSPPIAPIPGANC